MEMPCCVTFWRREYSPSPHTEEQPGAWQVCAPTCGNAKHNWQLLRELSCHAERGDQMVASSALSKRS